jgi:hypothetical protein
VVPLLRYKVLSLEIIDKAIKIKVATKKEAKEERVKGKGFKA